MPASVDIVRWTGGTVNAPGVKSVITSNLTRANAVDAHSGSGGIPADTANPVQIPASGSTSYSFWVTTQLFYNSGLSSTINNIRWYAPNQNMFGTGILCYGNVASQYVPCTPNAGNIVGQTGAPLTTAANQNGTHIGLLYSPVDVFTWTAASPLILSATGVTGGSIATTGVGFGNYMVYQIWITSSAVAGTSTAQTFTFKYDET